MDRQMITDDLALAEQHVADGERIVERQRALIRHLSHEGHDTAKAEVLLAQFIETQRAHIADRDWLQRELAECDAQETGDK
jgi:hypothetical protein